MIHFFGVVITILSLNFIALMVCYIKGIKKMDWEGKLPRFYYWKTTPLSGLPIKYL